MNQIVPVEDSDLEIELIPPSEIKSAHLIIRAGDPDHSLIVFLQEAPALRDALATAIRELAEMNLKMRRQREKSTH